MNREASRSSSAAYSSMTVERSQAYQSTEPSASSSLAIEESSPGTGELASTEREPVESRLGSSTYTDKDAALQITRRVDWRFLLPDPNLGRTAYLGPSSHTLVAALRHACSSVSTLALSDEVDQQDGDRATYDVVVLRWCGARALARAKALLRPGGWLYWEVDRSPTVPGLSDGLHEDWPEAFRLRHPRSYQALAERIGFGDVQVSWHRPNFDACLEIIPLDACVGLRYCLSRRHARLGGWLRARLGRSLMTIGLLPRVLPCVSLTACNRLPGSPVFDSRESEGGSR